VGARINYFQPSRYLLSRFSHPSSRTGRSDFSEPRLSAGLILSAQALRPVSLFVRVLSTSIGIHRWVIWRVLVLEQSLLPVFIKVNRFWLRRLLYRLRHVLQTLADLGTLPSYRTLPKFIGSLIFIRIRLCLPLFLIPLFSREAISPDR
jgi:hypothetical protein